MSEVPPILQMQRVTLESHGVYDSGVWDLDLALGPCDMALLRLERGSVRLPVADAAQGLLQPSSGTISFCGTDWQSMPAAMAASSRGRIGRVFEGHAWVGTLGVGENITLAQRHHTRRPLAEIVAEAGDLAEMFGLPGLPQSMPGRTHPQDLQRAACVRAFMGRPNLIILERPETGLYPEIMSPLMTAIRRARSNGAAILWTTTEAEVWQDLAIRSRRLLMAGSQVLAAAG